MICNIKSFMVTTLPSIYINILKILKKIFYNFILCWIFFSTGCLRFHVFFLVSSVNTLDKGYLDKKYNKNLLWKSHEILFYVA